MRETAENEDHALPGDHSLNSDEGFCGRNVEAGNEGEVEDEEANGILDIVHVENSLDCLLDVGDSAPEQET